MFQQENVSEDLGKVRCLTPLHYTYFLVALFVPGFVLVSWIQSNNGVPYYKDSNESYHTYLHARNMESHGLRNSFLTDEANSKGSPPLTYTHNPNLPRYFGYLLRLVGIKGVGAQTLILALAAAVLSAAFVYLFLSEWPGLLLIFGLFFGADFFGNLQFAVNSYRAWHFPLIFGCFAFSLKKHSLGTFISFFLLYQLEFTFAVFTTVATFVALSLDSLVKRDLVSMKILLAAAAGAGLSIVIYIGQLVSFYGVQGLIEDLKYTVAPSGGRPELYRKFRVLSTSSSGIDFKEYLSRVFTHTESFYSRFILRVVEISLLICSVGAAFWAIRGSPKRGDKPFMAMQAVGGYVVGMAIGLLVVGALLPGYTANAYLSYFFPMIVFVVGLAVSLLCYSSGSMITMAFPFSWRKIIGCIVFPLVIAVVLVPWIQNSLNLHRAWPLVDGTAGRNLKNFADKTFVTVNLWQMVTAHTDALCVPMELTGVDDLIVNPDKYKFAEYFFLHNTYHWNPPIKVEEIVGKLRAAGHEVAAGDANYAIVKLNWK